MTDRSSRWLAYVRWQLLDSLWQRFALPFAIAAMLVVFTFIAVRPQSVTPGFWTSPDGLRLSAIELRQAMMMFIPLAVLLGTNGMVSQDRQKGHYRFLFSKPVPVPAFYAVAWLAHLVVAVALAALMAAAIGWYTTPQPVLGVAMACALSFVLLGGLTVLFSALTNQDGALVIVVWLGTLLARQVEPAMDAGHWLHTAVRVLPPTHRLDAMREAWYASQPVALHDLWHVLAYGGACLALALLAVRKLPLAR